MTGYRDVPSNVKNALLEIKDVMPTAEVTAITHTNGGARALLPEYLLVMPLTASQEIEHVAAKVGPETYLIFDLEGRMGVLGELDSEALEFTKKLASKYDIKFNEK